MRLFLVKSQALLIQNLRFEKFITRNYNAWKEKNQNNQSYRASGNTNLVNKVNTTKRSNIKKQKWLADNLSHITFTTKIRKAIIQIPVAISKVSSSW